MKAISIFCLLLGVFLLTPAVFLFIDLWTWMMLGSGITPVDWTFVTLAGNVDKVGKPILAMLSGLASFPFFLVGVHMGSESGL